MFLSDRTICELVRSNYIDIDPFDEKLVQPCSYDLLLGDVALERELTLDSTWWVLHPKQFVLASTLERIRLSNDIAATVSGKSTWGRKGLAVHITAGHVDPCWNGQLTLELYNHSDEDIQLRKGRAIAQLVFTKLDLPALHPYAGRYQNSVGIVQPRASVEFQKALNG